MTHHLPGVHGRRIPSIMRKGSLGLFTSDPSSRTRRTLLAAPLALALGGCWHAVDHLDASVPTCIAMLPGCFGVEHALCSLAFNFCESAAARPL